MARPMEMKRACVARRVAATAVLAVFASCGSDDVESNSAGTPVTASTSSASPSNESTPPVASVTTPPTPTMAASELMAVNGRIVLGQQFTVAFSGRLRDLRGGYLVVRDVDGATVATLRSDGNTEIPMGYQLGPESEMLDDGLSGEQATFIFPAELSPGQYTLCTGNSGDEECLSASAAEA